MGVRSSTCERGAGKPGRRPPRRVRSQRQIPRRCSTFRVPYWWRLQKACPRLPISEWTDISTRAEERSVPTEHNEERTARYINTFHQTIRLETKYKQKTKKTIRVGGYYIKSAEFRQRSLRQYRVMTGDLLEPQRKGWLQVSQICLKMGFELDM